MRSSLLLFSVLMLLITSCSADKPSSEAAKSNNVDRIIQDTLRIQSTHPLPETTNYLANFTQHGSTLIAINHFTKELLQYRMETNSFHTINNGQGKGRGENVSLLNVQFINGQLHVYDERLLKIDVYEQESVQNTWKLINTFPLNTYYARFRFLDEKTGFAHNLADLSSVTLLDYTSNTTISTINHSFDFDFNAFEMYLGHIELSLNDSLFYFPTAYPFVLIYSPDDTSSYLRQRVSSTSLDDYKEPSSVNGMFKIREQDEELRFVAHHKQHFLLLSNDNKQRRNYLDVYNHAFNYVHSYVIDSDKLKPGSFWITEDEKLLLLSSATDNLLEVELPKL